jgi:hypothetical protein
MSDVCGLLLNSAAYLLLLFTQFTYTCLARLINSSTWFRCGSAACTSIFNCLCHAVTMPISAAAAITVAALQPLIMQHPTEICLRRRCLPKPILLRLLLLLLIWLPRLASSPALIQLFWLCALPLPSAAAADHHIM